MFHAFSKSKKINSKLSKQWEHCKILNDQENGGYYFPSVLNLREQSLELSQGIIFLRKDANSWWMWTYAVVPPDFCILVVIYKRRVSDHEGPVWVIITTKSFEHISRWHLRLRNLNFKTPEEIHFRFWRLFIRKTVNFIAQSPAVWYKLPN